MVATTRVLFLCTHNAARSQMAEALLRHYAGSRFEVSSAGLAPTTVHAFTRKALEEIGVDAQALHAKSLREFLGKVRFHYAIIVCKPTEEHCPQLYPFALQTLYWPFDDPVQADSVRGLHTFREVRDQIGVPGVIRGEFSVREIATKSPLVARHDYSLKNNRLS